MSTTRQAPALKSVDLFKIITVRDETIIGLTESDCAHVQGHDVSAVARALLARGELTVWQYAVRKGHDGDLELAPLRRVSILKHDCLRVEPYLTQLRVLAVSDHGPEPDL
jgi:hypothetical protein